MIVKSRGSPGRILFTALALFASGCTGTGTAVPAATPTAVQVPPTPTLLPTPTATQPPPSPTATETLTETPEPIPTLDLTLFTATATPPSQADTQAVADKAAKRIIRALHFGDMSTVAHYVSPSKGLLFETFDFRFNCGPDYKVPRYSPEQVKNLFSDETIYTWTCIVGDPSRQFKFRQFFVKQIMDLDYSQPTRVLYNGDAGLYYPQSFGDLIGAGYMLVEYVVQPEGYFESGLALVFQKEDDWRLIEVIHDGWTP